MPVSWARRGTGAGAVLSLKGILTVSITVSFSRMAVRVTFWYPTSTVMNW
jgi:hypothetical protein